MKIYKRKSLTVFLIGLCFMFSSCGYASSEGSPISKMQQTYCAFNGVLKDEDRWGEEFKMLEEPEDHPNFQKMNDILSIFMALPNALIERCPSLKHYLSELVKYHADNKNITKGTKEVLEYISQKKLSYSHENK